jgi:aerobic carbon-monoxide dehydrogenase large subunit
MKGGLYPEYPLVALAARLTGHPVKWISERGEGFTCDEHCRDNVTEAELALDNDGHFLGLRVNLIANVGAFLQVGGQSFVGNLGTLAGVYKTPAVYVDVTAVLTNTNPVRPYRGNGRPEAAYVIERMVDVAADELGIDPAVLRRKNSIPPDAMPYKTGLTFTYDSGEFAKNMDEALHMADADGFGKRRAESRKRGKLRGLGMSNTIERAAAPSNEGAEIRFDRGGGITLFSGANNQGQGHETAFKQIVCDRLGVDPKDITYISGDTDTVFYGEGTGGSRSATLGGSAVAAAADKVITKGKQIAAHVLKVAVDDVKFEDGLFSSPKSNQTLTVGDVARTAANPAKLPKGMEAGLTATSIFYADVENFPNGAHVCEVEIDEETGQVDIVRYSVVDDVGVVLNPLLVYGQITGGVAQGVGQILMEDIHFDPDSGQLTTGSFMDYAMPRADNISALNIHSNPVPTPTNPLGVKGCGEAGCVGAMPAVANAIVDALSIYGVRHIEMPATPERVWRAIQAARPHAAAE